MGTIVCRTSASLIDTIDTSAHGCPLLAAEGSIHQMEPQVMSRVGSKSAPSVTPISPPRSSRLWASSAAAHSTTPRREP
eukprot:959790-Pleurochrysis_carterae.AAC.1